MKIPCIMCWSMFINLNYTSMLIKQSQNWGSNRLVKSIDTNNNLSTKLKLHIVYQNILAKNVQKNEHVKEHVDDVAQIKLVIGKYKEERTCERTSG